MTGDVFGDLCNDDRWKSHHEFFASVEAETESDVKRAATQNREMAEKMASYIASNFDLKRVSDSTLATAEQLLLSGDVVGADGSYVYYPMLSGGRAQIAIATVSYANQRVTSAIFLSEFDFTTTSEDLIETLKQRRMGAAVLSQLAVRALMRYKEIDIALRRRERWLMFNGTWFPYELRSGAGQLRVVERSVNLLRRLSERSNAVSVVARSKEWHILTLGLGLASREYLCYGTLETDLRQFLFGDPDQGIHPANLRGRERSSFEAYINEVAPTIQMGIAKVGDRTYQFQAPAAVFDEAASIVIRDGLFQPIRGYPLLIDYADSVLHRLTPGGEFTRMVEFKLQKHGALLHEMDEHSLRRR